jgi:protein-S-isoprenylcysteine O-methyltransferase Ste14
MAIGIGTAFGAASVGHVVAAVALVILLNYKARFEESLLTERFGDDYRTYGQHVGRFLPWFGRFAA